MEATEEGSGILDQKILPPRLEDAGLEDCALPPDLIKQAFLKAATAVKSRATSIFTDQEEPDDCVQDPWPEEAKDASDTIAGVPPVPGASDTLVGVEVEKETQGSCLAGKGGGVVEEGADKVVVGGGDVEEKENQKCGCLGDGLKKKDENGNVEECEGDKIHFYRKVVMHGFNLQNTAYYARYMESWAENSLAFLSYGVCL